jgi:hypothetical protein
MVVALSAKKAFRAVYYYFFAVLGRLRITRKTPKTDGPLPLISALIRAVL